MKESTMTDVKTETKDAKSKSTALKLGWVSIVIGILALALGAVVLLAGFHHLSTLNQRQHVAKNNLATLTEQVAVLSKNSALQAAQIAEDQKHLQNVVTKNYQQDNAWILTESSYLVRQAQFVLTFDQNPDLAEQLLKTADSRVGSLNNPTLMTVRQALNDNIQALQAVPRVPIDSMLLKINALGTQIKTLSVVSDKNRPNQAKTTQQKPSTGWKRSLQASWEQLRQVIVVEYHPQPVNQMILPMNRTYLDMHLQMLLGQASWALMHHDATLYQQSLNAAIVWVQNNYINDAPATAAFLATLTQLAHTQTSPTLPDLSASLNAIQAAKTIMVAPVLTTEK